MFVLAISFITSSTVVYPLKKYVDINSLCRLNKYPTISSINITIKRGNPIKSIGKIT